MFSNPSEAAVSAVLSMLLEVSANPKPGNVDRDHNFPDLRYEHFLASSSASFPVFVEIANKKLSIGEGIYKLVRVSKSFHNVGNVHFGAFLLLTPLVFSWGDVEKASNCVRETTAKDSLNVKRAFDLSNARVLDVERLDLRDRNVEDEIVERDLNLYEWMKQAPDVNFIAKEYTNSFELSRMGKKRILDYHAETGDVNKAIVLCYVSMLSELLDPLVVAKSGIKIAHKVREMARESMEFYEQTGNFSVFHELDLKVLKAGVNPGSVADLTISSIYLALAEGWRF